MTTTFKVPIRNLFYLLSYAKELPEMVESLNKVDDELLTYDFLVEQFHKEVQLIFQRGIYKNYVEETVETNQLSGRLLMTESMPYIMRHKPYVLCEKDAYVANILINQIMKTTLHHIHNNPLIRQENRLKSFHLLEQLPEVSMVSLNKQLFFRVNIHRHNMYYKRMIHLAQLLFEMALLSQQQGDWSLFTAHIDDRSLSALFERFLFNFLQRKKTTYLVKRDRFSWKLAGNQQLLPTMLTDISLLKHNQKIIVDAKFYKNALQFHHGKRSFHSEHMYQMFAYLQHQPKDLEQIKGILIYPYNGQYFNETYQWNDQTSMQFVTVDLSKPWQNIEAFLLNLIP